MPTLVRSSVNVPGDCIDHPEQDSGDKNQVTFDGNTYQMPVNPNDFRTVPDDAKLGSQVTTVKTVPNQS